MKYFFINPLCPSRTLLALLASLAVSISLIAHAQNDKVCEDLHRLSCSPGVVDDGTGSAENPTSLDEEEFNLYKKIKQTSADSFRAELVKPQNNYFRKIALSATGLSLNPVCENAENSPSKECIDVLSKGISDISLVVIAKGGYGNSTSNSLNNLTYLLDSPLFKSTNAKILQQTRNSLGVESQDENIKNDIFPKVKSKIIEKINLYVADPVVRKRLVDKISAIQYMGNDCSNQVSNSPSVDGLLYVNAGYYKASNTFLYCSGLLMKNSSYYQAYFTIAHELSHSIDPCNIGNGPEDYRFEYKGAFNKQMAEQMFPFSGVLSCLRSNDSVAARDLSVATVNANGNSSGARGGMIGLPSGAPPAVFNSTAAFCEKDQIGESFADWMAAEILPELVADKFGKRTPEKNRLGFSNVARGMCDDERVTPRSADVDATDPHPYWYLRTNKVLLAQPKIRSLMGCPEIPTQAKYCKAGDLSYQQNAVNSNSYGSGVGEGYPGGSLPPTYPQQAPALTPAPTKAEPKNKKTTGAK